MEYSFNNYDIKQNTNTDTNDDSSQKQKNEDEDENEYVSEITTVFNSIVKHVDVDDYLPSKYPNIIPNLSLNIRKFASHRWNDCRFIYSSLKSEYQVKIVPIAHWGIKDILLIGACPVPRRTTQYPTSNNTFIKNQTRSMLTTIIKEHKVTVFMSLMAECDDENGDENSIFRPYSKLDLPEIDPSVKFFKLGIKDCNITDDNSILDFAKQVVKFLCQGEKVYLHCWGGHGRAGTVYCLVLQILYGMTASDALDYCQCIHDCRESFITVSSPQTLSQATQVIRMEARIKSELEAKTLDELENRIKAESYAETLDELEAE